MGGHGKALSERGEHFCVVGFIGFESILDTSVQGPIENGDLFVNKRPKDIVECARTVEIMNLDSRLLSHAMNAIFTLKKNTGSPVKFGEYNELGSLKVEAGASGGDGENGHAAVRRRLKMLNKPFAIPSISLPPHINKL